MSGEQGAEMADPDNQARSVMSEEAGRRGSAPVVGVRPASPARRRATPIVWVLSGGFDLALGDRVSVLVPCYEWLGEVVVPPDRLVEWPDVGTCQVPIVMRRATDDEWPSPPVTEGRRLLASLGLPPELLARRRPETSASGPLVVRSGPRPRDAAEDERRDQERSGDQREPE